MDYWSVVGTILAAALFAWLGRSLRRAGILRIGLLNAARGNKHFNCVDRMPLSAGHTLHLVHVSGRAMVVAVHPSGCSLLDRWMVDQREAGGAGHRSEAAHAG